MSFANRDTRENHTRDVASTSSHRSASSQKGGTNIMRKQDLVRAVAEATDSSESAATRAVNAVFESIERALADGDEVAISGFGTFKVVERSSRQGRNPQTGDPMTIEARKSPVFRPGTQLKRSVV